mgnify:CR=1 FL=1
MTISHKLAIMAKAAGYFTDKGAPLAYDRNGVIFNNQGRNNKTFTGFEAPTMAQLSRWLRETQLIMIETTAVNSWDEWISRIYANEAKNPFHFLGVTDGARTFELAHEQGLVRSLQFLLEVKHNTATEGGL